MKRVSVLLVAFSLSWINAATAATVVDLDKYLAIVREANPDLRAGARSTEAAYFGVLASVAYQRPALAAGATGSYLSGQKQMGNREKDITAANLHVGLTHRIDLSGTYTLDEQQQVLYYESQRALFHRNVNSLMASAEQAYWAAFLARENIALQKDVLRQRKENDRVTQEKYKQQLVPKLDIIRSEAQVVAAETLVTEAEAQYRNVLATLKALAGGTDVTLVEEPLAVPIFNVTETLEKALLSRPDVRAAQLALERVKIVKKLTAKGMSPTLDLGINWTAVADPWNSSSPQEGEVAASLRLNIPILDGNKTKYGVLNTDRQVMAAEASLESARNVTEMDYTVAQNNWAKAEALERDRKRQVERSDEELRITELMYNEGMGAQIDLINAQTDNQLVRTNYLDAVRGMYAALVELRKVVGDYAPDESGSWKEAVVRYGRGKTALDTPPKKSPEQGNKSVQQNKSSQNKASGKKKK